MMLKKRIRTVPHTNLELQIDVNTTKPKIKLAILQSSIYIKFNTRDNQAKPMQDILLWKQHLVNLVEKFKWNGNDPKAQKSKNSSALSPWK